MAKKDISERKDIELMVSSFYKEVLNDDVIGYLFTEVVKLDFDHHMPIMYDFWESVLLGGRNYSGNPMTPHFNLHEKESLKETHFERWIKLWEQTIRNHFEGPKANEAISRAKQIAGLMQFKIIGLNN
ncbi:group III truncated hemoglobin [Marinigracilibium pacificum]|uniref:Group III truncated hemoglobin n=1 Tax=Marinigracilibium pacificum TaxID=2729599 RepID=A0A848J2J1_9BACT|nr:group III truncated hemoglobin [Marinigracilibium pacificum]NMM47402.1 group III truncated hemoglobin [Marinigracilibium pacificum]